MNRTKLVVELTKECEPSQKAGRNKMQYNEYLITDGLERIQTMNASTWKSIDVIAYALLIIGALNWGLVGFFGFDLVAALFGPMTALSRMVYGLVGLAAFYDLLSLPSIFKRWEIHMHHRPVQA